MLAITIISIFTIAGFFIEDDPRPLKYKDQTDPWFKDEVEAGK
jgi:hypothetical protein